PAPTTCVTLRSAHPQGSAPIPFNSADAFSALPLTPPAPAAPKPTELHFGSEPWRLALSLGDLKPTEGAPSSADRHVYTYSNDRLEVLSVIVEDAHSPATLDSCRDVFARRKQGMPIVNEVQGQSGDAATQE